MAGENHLKKLDELISRLELTGWDDLPDIGLYMDQVTGLLNRQLAPFTMGRDDAPLTPGMINNYVRSGHIARPSRKKYSREQLGALYMLCSLKKNLSIPDAAALIYFLTEQEGAGDAYNRFLSSQRKSLLRVNEQISALTPEADMTELTELALDLVQQACAARLAAETVISHIIIKDDAKMARHLAEMEEEYREQEAARVRRKKSKEKE